MLFPSAAPQPVASYPITIGVNTVTFHIATPTTAQRLEDEDHQLKASGVRVHRLRSCIQGWEGLEDDHGPVGYTIYKLFELCDSHPEVLTELKAVIDPLFA